jgi:DNA repair exonuclease SbcCD ATPase subunit
MSPTVRISSLFLIGALLAAFGMLAVRAHADEPVTCSAEAKVCPDGSSVSRTGPNCEFALCPGETVRSTPIRDQVMENAQQRRDLLQAQQQERQTMREDVHAQFVENRAASGTREALQARMATASSGRQLLSDQQQERAMLRATDREALKGAVDEKRAQLQARLTELKQQMQDRKDQLKARLSDALQARLGTHIDTVGARMDSAIERLTQIADRIGTRIDSLQGEGADVADAGTALDDAYSLIDAARGDVTDFKTVAADVLASEDPKARMSDVRDAADLVKASLKAARSSLSDALKSIKDVVEALHPAETTAADGQEGETGADGNDGASGEDASSGDDSAGATSTE